MMRHATLGQREQQLEALYQVRRVWHGLCELFEAVFFVVLLCAVLDWPPTRQLHPGGVVVCCGGVLWWCVVVVRCGGVVVVCCCDVLWWCVVVVCRGGVLCG